MTPKEFEQAVANHYQQLGYQVSLTGDSYDYGVDVIAKKGDEAIVIQAKMYDHVRQVNYQNVMYVFAAMYLYDCNKAILITSGFVREDAISVASKLGVEIHEQWDPSTIRSKRDSGLNKAVLSTDNEQSDPKPELDVFGIAWQKFVMPLKGKRIRTYTGKENTITDVDWNYVKRISSNGESSKLGVEIFRQSFHYVIDHGQMTRNEINQLYTKRGSAVIFAVLSEIPFFDVHNSGKATLRLNKEKYQQFKTDETHGA